MVAIRKNNTEYCVRLQVQLTILDEDDYSVFFYVYRLGLGCSVTIEICVVVFERKMRVRL